jgi:class 3 adenylate cyclase/predicted ATPase/energy-coupling factor transporter ATP-binding protein EcfA2
MTFEEILDQAIAMLQRRGRLTYSTLKRQFQLDDAALEDLKNELIEGQRLAVDERGNVLVWTGGADVPQLRPSPPTADVQPTQGLPPAAASRPPDAERRQLTVMFCDLVASTQLSGRLDPEEYRDVVRAYHTACTAVIGRYDGHIAQLLGDGLLVYFGYPQAHEDDPQRAVRTGLGILTAMGDLNQGLQRAKGFELAIRLGIHTGLVVVGAMGGGGRQEQLALGETPNVAARIQGLAVPNTVVMSDATYRLVQGYFQCQAMGAQTLRGVGKPISVYCVLSESGATSRLDVAQPRGLTPLVGRESEVTLLQERWQQAKSGQGQIVLLTGDAGIGKSRLVQMLKEHVANESHVRWECRSSEHSQNTALFPLVDLFQRLLRLHAEDTPDAKLGKLEQALSQYRLPLEESVLLFAPLLSLPISEDRYPPLNVSPQRQRQKMLESLVAIMLELAERQPVLFILEDLHWTDPTTLELLNLLIEQTPTASLLGLLTCRPHFQPAWHHRSYITEMTLNHLSHTQVEQIVACITNGKALPPEVLRQIIGKTDGVPLFVEEMTKAILESGQLKALDDRYEPTGAFATFAIPATLHDSLMARLDRLVTAKAVAQYGAVIGRQFAYELLQVVSQVDEVMLQHELGRLVEAEIVYQRGVPPQSTYVFKHALIQDAAYESLLKSTRQHYHQRIAQVLEAQFPETAEAEPELLAHHYTEAGLSPQAVRYWQRAGQQALARSANVEAVSHCTRGLAVLQHLPESPARLQQELDLQTALGPALMATKGFAALEVEQVYTRARTLCRHLGATPQLFPVLWGAWMSAFARAELQSARELGEELLTLAESRQDPALLLGAHQALGQIFSQLGECTLARVHLEQGMALSTLQPQYSQVFLYGQEPRVACLSYAASTLWDLGYPNQAREHIHTMLTLARELSHPFNLVSALLYAAQFPGFRREGAVVQALAEEALALCREQGFALGRARGTLMRGWAFAAQGQREEGLAQMCQGLAAFRVTGARAGLALYLGLLAEVYGGAGQPTEGLRTLAEAIAVMYQHGLYGFEANLHWLKGELLLAQLPGSAPEAETCFQQALDVARRQEAKSLELRAAMSLARLWQRQGKRQKAHDLLAPVYGWFTEGFDTADLQEAKSLLDTLA